MSIPRPVDGYKGQMTTPPDAWPESDEDALQNHATELGSTQTRLRQPLDKWRLTRTQIFDGSTWFGSASKGASAEVDARINAMQSIDDDLSKAITFFHNASTSVLNAKKHIVAVCDQAQQEIDGLADQDFKDDSDRQSAVREIVDAAHDLNTVTVSAAADAIAASKEFTPSPLPTEIGPPRSEGPPSEGSPSEGPLGIRTSGAAGSSPPAGNDTTKLSGYTQATPPNGQPPLAAPAGNDITKQHAYSQGVAGAGTPATPGTPASPGTAGTPSTPATPGVPAPVPAVPVKATVDTTNGVRNAPVGSGPQYFHNNPAPAPPKPAPAAPGPATPIEQGPSTTGGGSTPSPMSGPSGGGGSGPGTPSSSSGGGGNGDTSQPSQMGEHSQDGNAKATAGADQTPLTPAQQQQAMLSDISKGIDQGSQAVQANPMVSPANAAQLPVNPQVPVDAPAPPSATAGPGASGGGGIPSGGGFSGGGGGGSSAAPIGGMSGPAPTPMPLGPPATPTPAAPVGGGSGSGSGGTVSGTPGSTPTGPGVHAASTANTSAAGVAAPAPIPVSAARMERDAMAASAGAGAARRQKNGGNDALTLARRIGAALNVGVTDFGFFWVTGLCADGTIVVANSYGLGYIPDSANLPAQVQLVTADESIPPSERAKWATYPILALQGWAQAHGQKLRAIIATEAQFANFDPGTAKVVLQPDDIPDTGTMEGRSRLEVIAPAAAARLASVSDLGLMELLPPAPADPQPPADDSAMLWFDLCKPLMSTMPDRGVAHLEAFVTYAEHAQDLALYRAHTALDAATQRAAIADWVYWQHIGVLMSDALSADVAV
jgi:hypothetical protein